MINPLFLILQSISGGVAGYITNKYAVNMLFKEYTPLKLGGVVKKNKEKFIEEISTLVEKDIINGRTLKQHIHGEEFKKQLDIAVEEFCNSGLKEAFNDIKIKDISSFEESKDSIMQFTESKIRLVWDKLLINIVDNIEITKIFSVKQIEYITDIVYDEVIGYIKLDNKTALLLKDIYHQNSSLTINEVVDEEIIAKIKVSIEELLINSLENIFDDEEKLSRIIIRLYDVIEIDEIIIKLFKEIGSKTLDSYFSVEEKEQIVAGLFTNLSKLLNSDKGVESVNSILLEVIKITKELDFTLYELLAEESALNLSKFIEEMTIKVMPSIAQWIRFNKDEVNKIIEESIDESIEGMDGAIKRIIIQKVRESLFSDISEKASVVDKIISYINEYEINAESARKISEGIISYLKNNKVKDIICKLEEAKVISTDNIKALSKIIIEKINLHGEKLLRMVIEAIFSKKISAFISEERINFLKIKFKELLISRICQERKGILKFLQQIFTKLTNDKINEIIHMPLENLLSEDSFNKISEKTQDSLRELLEKNKKNILQQINTAVASKVSEIDLMKIVEDEKNLLESSMVKLIVNFEEEIISKYSENTIDEVINDICNKDKLIEASKCKIYSYLDSNIEEVLDGNIKNIIYDNLIKFNEDEICDLAQSFMGNELKPLSIFGGILGLIVGLIYGMFTNNVSITGFSGNIASTLVSCIIMAMIGVATNVIALKMLFYPYKRNKFLAKIPFLRKFSLGYIPAHKDTMARGIGHVIDEELLNGERVKTLLSTRKDMFKGYIISSISESNYKVITDSLRAKQDSIVRYLYNGIRKNVEKNRLKIADKAVEGIGSISTDKVIKPYYLSKIILNTKKISLSFSEKVADYLESKIKTSKKIKEIIEEEQFNKIREVISNNLESIVLKKSKDILKEENIQKIILKGEEKYIDLISKSLFEIIPDNKSENLKKYLKDKAMILIFNESQDYIEKAISGFLEREIDGDNTIGNAFSGKLAAYIDSNIPKLSRYIISKGESYLKANRLEFSERVKGEITSGLNFLERGAYMMFGGNAIVDRCVDTIIDIKVPMFLDNKYLEITSVVQSTLAYSIYPTPINKLQLKAKEINCSKVLDSVFVSFNKSDYVKEEIRGIIDDSINILFNEKIKELLPMRELSSLKGIYHKFNNEVTFVLEESVESIANNINELVKFIDKIIDEEVIYLIKETSINKVMAVIEKQDISNFIQSIGNIVLSNEKYTLMVEKVIDDFYEEVLKRSTLKNFLNKEYLSAYIEEYIEVTFKKKEFNDSNTELLNVIVEEVINDGFSFAKEDTKDDLICRVIEAVLNVTFDNTSEILQAINLKQITMEQIAIMEPKDIHIMFNGFAGDFFKKLYLYGSFGAIFGVNLWLSIAWGIVEEINNKRAE